MSARLERDHTMDRLVETPATVGSSSRRWLSALTKIPAWFLIMVGALLVGLAFGAGYWRGTAQNEGRAWSLARAEDTPEAYRSFRADFPNGVYAEDAALALVRTMKAQEVWTTAVEAGSVAGFAQFVREHPNHPEAQELVEQTSYMARAFESFQRGDTKNGFRLLSEFGLLYPNSPMADDAVFWTGEFQFGQDDHHGARASLLYGLKTYPDSNMAGQATVTLGLAEIAIGQKRSGCQRLAAFLRSPARTDKELIQFAKDTVEKEGC